MASSIASATSSAPSSQSLSSTQVPSHRSSGRSGLLLDECGADARSPRPRSCRSCRRSSRRRRRAAATPPASNRGGRGAGRRRARPRSRRAVRLATFWSLRRRARSSADAVRKILTSASGSTTVPMSRPSTTTLSRPVGQLALQRDQPAAHGGHRRHRRHRLGHRVAADLGRNVLSVQVGPVLVGVVADRQLDVADGRARSPRRRRGRRRARSTASVTIRYIAPVSR